jgi:hypothetical protein
VNSKQAHGKGGVFWGLVISNGQELVKHTVRLRAFGIDLISAEVEKTTQILILLTQERLVSFFRTAMFIL